MESSPLEKLEGLLIEGLLIDGEHHKQWYLEEALKRVRTLIGRPFPDDMNRVWVQIEDGRWGYLPEHPLYKEGVAP